MPATRTSSPATCAPTGKSTGATTARSCSPRPTTGLRYDNNHLFLSESQLQPRIGAAYYIPRTNTVVRASYDKMFITPEYENILLSSSAQASSLVPPEVQASALAGFGHLFNRAEHHNAINAGIQQGFGKYLRADVSW